MQNCNKVIISCATAAFALLCGCTSGEGEGLNDKAGRINLSVTADKTLEQVTSRSTEGPDMSFLESLSAQDLAIVLQSTEGASYSRKWSSVSEFPAEDKFPAGSYMITAYYGETNAEGYDKPLLFGTADFSVIAERSTQVSLTATIANSIVYLETTDNFKNYFQNYSLSIVSPRGYNIYIPNSETRPVYVNPGTVTINASVTLPSGKQGNINLGRFTAKAATLQRVTLNVENNAGDAVLSVDFDETLAEEQIKLDLSEDLFNAAAPEINPEGFTSENNSFSFVQNAFDGECAINIAAQAGLSAAKLTISEGEGKGTDYDLLDQASLAALSELGIKFINVNTGSKLAKINLKDYLDSMKSEDLFTPRNTSIKLSVTDALNRPEEIAFATEVSPKEIFELKPSIKEKRDDSYILLAPGYEINVASNLGDPEDPGIEWSVVDIDGNELAQPALNKGENPGEFTLAFTTPEKASDFVVTAKAEGKEDHTWNIHVPRCKINEIKDYDVWAKHTHFTLEPENKEDLDIILSHLDIQGGNYTKAARENDNLTFDLTELTPGTGYTLTLTLAETKQLGFTTEMDLSVPNGDFEDLVDEISGCMIQGGTWSISKGIYYVSGINYNIKKPTYWTTVNAKTANINNTNSKYDNSVYTITYKTIIGTSRTSTSNLASNISSKPKLCSWYNVPSTFNTSLTWMSQVPKILVVGTGDDTPTQPEAYKYTANNGTNAMVIRNVGWDEKKDAPKEEVAEFEGANDYYNHNVPAVSKQSSGKLFLGSYAYDMASGNETYTEGIEFASRPSKIKGFYTYTQDPHDTEEYGTIKIELYSGSELIGSGSGELTKSDEFNKFEVPIEYHANAKATSLRIMIASSNHASYNQAEESRDIKTTAHNELHLSDYHGATLVVDNLTFEYE